MYIYPKCFAAGDELKLRHRNASNRGAWEGTGNVLRFDQTEEVCLELRDSVGMVKCVGKGVGKWIKGWDLRMMSRTAFNAWGPRSHLHCLR